MFSNAVREFRVSIEVYNNHFNAEVKSMDVKRRLDLALTARPDYVHSSAFDQAYNTAAGLIQAASATTNAATRGKNGQLALDQLALAQDLLLSEYGVSYARTRLPLDVR